MVRSCLLNWIYTTACHATTWGYLILLIIPPDHSQIDGFLTTASNPHHLKRIIPIMGFYLGPPPQPFTHCNLFCKQYST